MKSLQEIQTLIEQVKKLVEAGNKSDIKLSANGGNSILIVCPPIQEYQFIEVSRECLNGEKYELIDLNQLLIEFITQYKKVILQKFDLLQSSVNQIFKAPTEENENDFFKYIIEKINNAFLSGKVPLLFSVGSLYGTGIDNIQIIEHDIVMKAPLPLVILYPATDTKDKLMYLDSRPASKYRCMIIN